jgi:hypothetical protein
MGILAIGDLHLSTSSNKPMDVFGGEWENHIEKIREGWNRVVDDGDLVIVAGDISWAMHLDEALSDLNLLDALKGTKLLLRGNHDYWWSSISKVRAVLPPSILALQNDSFTWQETVICGTRGWICPGEEGFTDNGDEKVYLREVQRLQLSLDHAVKSGCKRIIAAMHYPPYNRNNQESDFTKLLEEYNVEICVFGHIHDQGRDYIFQGLKNGVQYCFVAADGINFTPVRLF